MNSLINGLSSNNCKSKIEEKDASLGMINWENDLRSRSPVISVRKSDINPLKSGLMVNEEAKDIKMTKTADVYDSVVLNNCSQKISNDNVNLNQKLNTVQQQPSLSNGFTENYYVCGVGQPKVHLQTRNISIDKHESSFTNNHGFGSEENKNMSYYNIKSKMTQNYGNANCDISNAIRPNMATIPKLKISSNGLSNFPNNNIYNGVTDFSDMKSCREHGVDFRELGHVDHKFYSELQNGTQNNAFDRVITGSNQYYCNNNSVNGFINHFSENRHNDISSNNQRGDFSRTTNIQNNNNENFMNLQGNKSYNFPELSFQSEQKLNNLNKSFIPNSAFQTNISLNPQFSTRNSSNPSQLTINPSNSSTHMQMTNHRFLNSIPLLAQIQIESIQDMTTSQGPINGGIYNSSTNMSYSIVASFNNIDDRNETYKIGPFPSTCINTNTMQSSCIVQDEISLPFNWSQPNLKIKILEENDFRADIIGSCSIFVDANSIGIPSQAYLADPQTNQFRGTLRFLIKLTPNQQNPNYRYDQIQGPNSILNRRENSENSIFDLFRGFCCVD